MLTPEQYAAILKATGRPPPAQRPQLSPVLPRLSPVQQPLAIGPPTPWLSLVDERGRPTKNEPPKKRGRPSGKSVAGLLQQQHYSRPTGLSQEKGVNKTVERHLKERLDWLVGQLYQHYEPDYQSQPDRMSLKRRDSQVSFDGMWVKRAPLLPDWMVEHSSRLTGKAVEDAHDELADAFFQNLAWNVVPGCAMESRGSVQIYQGGKPYISGRTNTLSPV